MTSANGAFIGDYADNVTGVAVAVKDLIDMAGEVTGAGCKAVMDTATPAVEDAACLAGTRRAERDGLATIVGRTVMDELAAGATGINPWTGTPTNPADASRIPGGSSSGSAVAVRAGLADVGFGTDTGGSVRIPAACCGIAGLKTGIGRIPTAGVHPLSQTLDTVGPLARTVEGLVTGMTLLEPGFQLAPRPASSVGRIRLPDSDPVVDSAIDDALTAAGFAVRDIELDDWSTAHDLTYTILISEAWQNNQYLLSESPEKVSPQMTAQLVAGGQIPAAEVESARRFRLQWIDRLAEVLDQVDALCLPTLSTQPPRIDDADRIDWRSFARTMPINLAGLPALALPVPSMSITSTAVPPSLQLIGPRDSEGLLLRTGELVEDVVTGSAGQDGGADR